MEDFSDLLDNFAYLETFAKFSKLNKDSTVLLNQIRTIDKLRIIKKISSLNGELLRKINWAIKTSLDLD